MRHATVATACRARLVVVVLALLVAVLGLLGAASFSVYRNVPIPVDLPDVTTAMTSASATDDIQLDDWQPDNLTPKTSSSFIFDSERAEVTSSACVTSNQTDCSTVYVLMNTGYCGQSYVILSETAVHYFNIIHSLIYPFCLLTVLVLYTLIYRSVLVQRARRLKMCGSAIALARPPDSPIPIPNVAAGIFLLI